MRIQNLSLYSYDIELTTAQKRSGILLHITGEQGNQGWGEIAPLPQWSRETIEECLDQLEQTQSPILQTDWSFQTCFKELKKLSLFPSVSFGLESALLSLLSPLSDHTVSTSALLMGSLSQILEMAEKRRKEGYLSAKLKVGQLTFTEAAEAMNQLKDQFRLRIDVNRAWNTKDSLRFFSQFSLDAFDYVEEPFQNPHDLIHFVHPLAIDESFPHDLSLKELHSFPSLKALIYKPTLQGGLANCLPLFEWAKKKELSFILSSSFESDLGLVAIASMAERLSLKTPLGVGTYHYLTNFLHSPPLKFSPFFKIPAQSFISLNFSALSKRRSYSLSFHI